MRRRSAGRNLLAMTEVAVTVIGNDRVGIVAGITKLLYDLGCNLEDVTSTILRGHFAMMLVVHPPEGVDAESIESRLRPVGDELGVIVTARPVDEATLEVGLPTHMVSVYGSDKPGIVYKVAAVLSACGANITDLTSRVTGATDHPVYALLLEVQMTDPDAVESALTDLKDELGVDVTVRPLETDLL
jgi:glycine cleavage system transcriptional repressor